MGICNPSLKVRLSIALDQNYFTTKKIHKEVPVMLSLHYLLNYLKKYLKKEFNNLELLMILRVHNKIYTSNSNLAVADLNLKKQKVYVSAKLKKSIYKNIILESRCCETTEKVIEVKHCNNYNHLCKKIIKQKSCCNKKLFKLVVNDRILSDQNDVYVSSPDKIYAVFDEDDLENLPNYWDLKKSGLNLRSVCYNPNCDMYKKEILINRSYGEFSMKEELYQEYKCKSCDENLQLKKSILFVNCSVLPRDPKNNGNFGEILKDSIKELEFKPDNGDFSFIVKSI